MSKLDRRAFLKCSTLAGAGAGYLWTAARGSSAAETVTPQPASHASKGPAMLLGGRASLSRPTLAASQLKFRLGMARTRSAAYPLDSMDFIMMDLERPDGCVRHAHWCTGDLTGRLLEFLSCSDGVDGGHDPRLSGLFERILKQRRPSGIFGRYACLPQNRTPEDDPWACGNRLFSGLIRYYDLTGDARALESAEGMAKRIWSVRDAWRDRMKGSGARFIEAWVSEPFARLYGITRDPRWLEFCDMVRQHIGTCEQSCHSHGFMSTLRGLQIAALVTGDASWADKVEVNRRLIIDKRFELPNGDISEGLPHSVRNEGCSIADWMMLNLNAGLINNDDKAYDKAERIFWNALAFNQLITGGFGQRSFTPNGYGLYLMEEAWWCCLHNAGMGMSEYARHAVTFRGGAIHVNLLVPGEFTVPLPNGALATVRIATSYPAKAEATVESAGVPTDMAVKLRVPTCITRPELVETRTGPHVRLVLKGKLGHRIEPCNPGVMVTYGPLVLIPAIYQWSGGQLVQPGLANAAVPAGYIPETVPPGAPTLKVRGLIDADGFAKFPDHPLPEWVYFDEGPGSRTGVEGASTWVPVKFPSGEVKPLRFTPMCYNTSCLSPFETPLVFRDME